VIDVSLTITSDLIFSKLNEEREKGALASLPKEFYAEVSAFIESMNADASGTKQKQTANARRMLHELKEKRKQKLLIYLAYDKPLPQPMPDEEEALYNEIRRILNRTGESGEKTARIKILADVPEILTAEGRKIGPYQQGAVVEMARGADAEFMLKNKIGELIA
jgi:DNA replication initiation complex subunit (GINS family)